MKDISLKLKTKNGDFDLLDDKNTLYQNQNVILSSDKGKIINNLLMGVGITKYLNGPINIAEINNNIKQEMIKDKINIKSINIVNGEIYIESNNVQ